MIICDLLPIDNKHYTHSNFMQIHRYECAVITYFPDSFVSRLKLLST